MEDNPYAPPGMPRAVASRLDRAEQLARNEALVRTKVQVELDRGARFLEQRVGAMFGGLPGLFLNPLAGAAYRTVGRDEIVRRARHQVDILLAAARDHGTRPEVIFDGHLTRYLAQDEVSARANPRHRRFPELEGLVREVYVARVEPLSLLLHRGIGEDYGDLVRSVWPMRDGAQRIVEREFLYSDRILALAREERDLITGPPLVRREVGGVLKDAYAWYKATMQRTLDEVYGGAPGPGPASAPQR